jgi:hypothetical protein
LPFGDYGWHRTTLRQPPAPRFSSGLRHPTT